MIRCTSGKVIEGRVASYEQNAFSVCLPDGTQGRIKSAYVESIVFGAPTALVTGQPASVSGNNKKVEQKFTPTFSGGQFFGERFRAKDIVICIDISLSMIQKGVLQDALDEASRMLASLEAGTRFNLVVFVDGALAFDPQLCWATADKKQEALSWLQRPFSPRDGNQEGFSGGTPFEAIKMAVSLGADTVFVLTDAMPYLIGPHGFVQDDEAHPQELLEYIRGIRAQTGRAVAIYPILYKPKQTEAGKEAQRFYQRIAQMTGGKCRIWPVGWKVGK